MGLPGQFCWCILVKFEKLASFETSILGYRHLFGNIAWHIYCNIEQLFQPHLTAYYSFRDLPTSTPRKAQESLFQYRFISYHLQRIKLSLTTRFHVPIIMYTKTSPNFFLGAWELVSQSENSLRGHFSAGVYIPSF